MSQDDGRRDGDDPSPGEGNGEAAGGVRDWPPRGPTGTPGGDGTDEEDGDDGSDGEGDGEWPPRTVALFVGFVALTLLGVAFSTGWAPGPGTADNATVGPVVNPNETETGEAGLPRGVAVPPFVYLYASLGALGYVFTNLMTRLHAFDEATEFRELMELGLRIPGAWLLAAGVYLLTADAVAGSVDGAGQYRLAAGMAFLVGLYVNVAYKTLGELADRLLGRGVASVGRGAVAPASDGDRRPDGDGSSDDGRREGGDESRSERDPPRARGPG